ncbi:AAA family ATPase [Thioalkalivibrio sp. HK1]|uniref:AAA family ATPase n=1 Tax=Thioalkalivibrio sp. HK1 TaxID=1469245 RepID=UPI0004B41418|nr:AAA family ATPase [Thioalkalivibrio sp. HK1]
MRNAPPSKNLTLKVEDFGPIIEAEIDLRPLTVFAGPSNTGKSWLAILIYALHRYIEEIDSPYFLDRVLFSRLSKRNEISKEEIDTFIDSLGVSSKEKYDSSDSGKIIDLPDFIVNAISKYLERSNERFANHICRALGIEDRRYLIRHSTRQNHASISLIKKINCSNKEILNRLFVFKGDELDVVKNDLPRTVFMNNSLIERISNRIDDERDDSTDSDELIMRHRRLLSLIARQCIASWVDPLSRSISYLPAGRTGIMRAHTSIVSAVISNAASSILPSTSPPAQITGTLADFLEQMISIDSSAYRRRRFSHHVRSDRIMKDHSAEIEKNIIDGKIEVIRSPHINYPEITYRPKGWKRSIPLLNTSSMISELAPIVLFIRHKVMEGSVLIIEEPESHLHPAMQVELTQQLAALVGSGVRVILTTHSEWILESLSNIVYSYSLKDISRSNIPDVEIALNPEQVGIWLFKKKKSPKGSVVEEMTWEKENGIYRSDYEAISENLYNKNASIYNEIHNGEIQ